MVGKYQLALREGHGVSWGDRDIGIKIKNQKFNFDGLVQDWSNSIALAIELLQSCTKPLIWCLNNEDVKSVLATIENYTCENNSEIILISSSVVPGHHFENVCTNDDLILTRSSGTQPG